MKFQGESDVRVANKVAVVGVLNNPPFEAHDEAIGHMHFHVRLGKGNGAQERTRTFTAVKPLAPEASASTNSATWARAGY